MKRHAHEVVFWLALAAIAAPVARLAAQEQSSSTNLKQALAFLALEVPRWSAEHRCYSCHNNGDAARALMTAAKAGETVARKPLADALLFLAAPEGWDDNGPDGPFKDKKLARIQFAAALVAANSAGLLKDRDSLSRAAALVAELQLPDGHWETEAADPLGSPATYGRHLATHVAAQTLRAADATKYRAALDKARDWFEQTPINNIMEAAATLWALAGTASETAHGQRQRCLALIAKGQSADGGWGPYVTAPPEAFDTALVLLALAAQTERAPVAAMIDRGRGYLLAAEQPDGSWPATTRPSGADSYAQQLSTTAWAVQALLATSEKRSEGK